MTEPTRGMTDGDRSVDELAENDRYRLLSAERRRTVLDVLATRTAPVDISDVAEGVAARENDVDVVDENTVRDVAVSLHHVHLPRMADVGVIDYDPERNRIESHPELLDS